MIFCLVLQPEQQRNVLQIRWVSFSGASMKRSHVLLGSRGVKAAATHPKGPSEDESLSTECSVYFHTRTGRSPFREWEWLSVHMRRRIKHVSDNCTLWTSPRPCCV